MMRKTILLVVWIVMGICVANGHEEEEKLNWAAYGHERLSTVVISGKLFCTPKRSRHPYPLSGASVGVFCGTSNGKRRKSWAKGSTNSYGEFLIDVPSHLHAIPNLEKICVVEVLHLPRSSPCKHAFNGKRKGIKLTSMDEGLRIYTTTRNIHLLQNQKPPHSKDHFKQKRTTSVF